MPDDPYVIDACVFSKLYLKEEGSEKCKSFFLHVVENEIPLIVPSLIVYELLNVARRCDVPISTPLSFLRELSMYNLDVIEPEYDHFEKAIEISAHGNKKAGYPQFYDAIYHAIAICEEGIFITSDEKYLSKTKKYDHAVLLKDWKP
ncbi:MAG: type II toxin-antitoxin system VapC family toxin [Candidatus Margulisbacteria bacterium]|nr:type II toxin-antitoxin system VapC family toxin [Candidatus Margulisiibacteriota bacterium]